MGRPLTEITPTYDANFRAEAFLDTYQIVSLSVHYDFDSNLEHVAVRQDFEVRRVGKGPSRWCARIVANSHLECEYEDSDGRPLDSMLVLDSYDHHYMVCNFPSRVVSQTSTFRFSLRMRKRVEFTEQQIARTNEKAIFLTQVYGTDCSNYRMVINWPSDYTLVNSIPRLKRNTDGYVYAPSVRKFDPVEVALVLKRGLIGQLRKVFSRDTHPFVWVLVAAAIPLVVALTLKIWKLLTGKGE